LLVLQTAKSAEVIVSTSVILDGSKDMAAFGIFCKEFQNVTIANGKLGLCQ